MNTIVQQDGRSTAGVEAVSGDLRVGNFAILAAHERNSSGPFAIKLYWMPIDVVIAKTAKLTVTMVDQNIGAVASTQVFGGDGNWARSPSGEYFWPTNILLPSAGSWRMVGTVPGLSSGCFDFDVS